jgi:putative aldouronate transport system permease protein
MFFDFTIKDIIDILLFALLLYEIRSKVALKVFHTCILLPAFLSWTVVAAAFMLFLQPDNGFLNSVLEFLGMKPINWYREKEYWPFILLISMLYKESGMASIYFYSALLSIDTQLFDAAKLDGANRIKQIRHISLPATAKVFCITLVTCMGGVLSGAISPYYQMTLNSDSLRETTLVLGTYLLEGVQLGRYSYTAAVGILQSVIGLILVVSTNMAIKKVDPESAMF